MGGGGKGSQEYTVGYRYYADVHMVLCHGPIWAVTRIVVGDKDAFPSQTVTGAVGDGELALQGAEHYALFGGEDGEGGVFGKLDVMSGLPGQAQNKHLARPVEQGGLGEDVPAFRGVAGVVLKDFMICAVNPYPKPWRFVVRRSPTPIFGSGLGDTFANPANIIAECLTNEEWGLGVPMEDLDTINFNSVAGVLAVEGFGLCARWDQTCSVEDFIGQICQIIDGQLGMHPTSGKYTLKLIRQDYDVRFLPVLDPSNILTLSDFSRPDPAELINEVVVVFENYQTGVQQSVTEKDTAALAINPAVNSVQLDYQPVPTQSLARRIALRELAQYTSGLARCTLECNREAAGLMMGDCLVLTWPPLGIDRMIMRVTSAVQGRTDDWRVRLDCVQDVYGLPDALFSEAETGWKPPDYTPKALSLYRSYELPYHLVALFVTGDNASSWSDQPEGFGYAAAVAAKPSGLTAGFKVSADGEIVRSLDFTDHALLAEAVDDVAQSMTVSGGSVEGISAGEPFLLDDEWMTVYSYDSSTGALMAGRGCLDTVPAPHAAGAVAWFPGTYNNAVRKTYVHGQNAQISLIPFSVNGAQASSAYAPVAMSNRASRPVAPANVRVNGVYRPKSLAPWATVLDWSRRDRKYTGGLVPNGAGDYVPEAGTEARAAVEERLFPGSAWTPGSTSAGLTGTSLPLAGLYTACAYALRFSLSSRLGPLDSLQTNVVETVHSPWIPEALSMTLTAPPASPSRGDWYIVPSGASGAWAGQAGRLAAYTTSWQFHSPAAGQRADVAGDVREWDGSQWQEV